MSNKKKKSSKLKKQKKIRQSKKQNYKKKYKQGSAVNTEEHTAASGISAEGGAESDAAKKGKVKAFFTVKTVCLLLAVFVMLGIAATVIYANSDRIFGTLSSDSETRGAEETEPADVTPPELETCDLDILDRQSFTAEDLIASLSDSSETEISMVKQETDDPRKVRCFVVARDSHGNETVKIAYVNYYPVKSEITVECGTSKEDILKLISLDEDGAESLPELDESVDISSFKAGKNSLLLKGENNTLTVSVILTDTIPPVLAVKDVTVLVGDEISADKFVSECTDCSDVKFSFEEVPSTENTGKFDVVIVATDAGNNKTSAKAKLIVKKASADITPPEINGVHDITVTVGEAISYRSGITVTDDKDDKVKLKVDSSKVKASKVGTYTVVYIATDSSGNETRVTAKVTVKAVDLEAVNAKVDKILAQIITPQMTDREKAEAIYNWCSTKISYSQTANKNMEKLLPAAFESLTTKRGICYNYYAVSQVMFDRVGIESMEIRRDSKTNPHYWNLVKIDGSWYHFDACPHYRGYPLKCFLLTDAQVAEYSEKVSGYYSFDSSLYPKTP